MFRHFFVAATLAVVCWFGTFSLAQAASPAVLTPDPTGVLDAGGYHTCALTPAGAIDCWGRNLYGESDDHIGPYTQLSAGETHTCALTAAGAAHCWGWNFQGAAEDQPGPYTQISAGAFHVCALTPAGAADCWGFNGQGQAGFHSGPYTQLTTGRYQTCGLTIAGAADCWGWNSDGQAEDYPGPYSQLSAGGYYTCGLTTAGAVDCWGNNGAGQAVDQAGPYTQISAGDDYMCALTPNRTVDCWGTNTYGQADALVGPYTLVSAGNYYTCALTQTGKVDCWGGNFHGLATDHPGPYRAYRPGLLAAGNYHTCALTVAGAADCWGYNEIGQADDQLGPYTNVSGGREHTCALTPTGAVDCWGLNNSGQAADQLGPYTQATAGHFHNCALTPAGAAECWGYNNDGQAGFHIGPYTQLSAGGNLTCALKQDGAVDCWGDNNDGQADDQLGPYTQVSVGRFHTCALTPAGMVDCWGWNDSGRANDQAGPYTQVSAGEAHTCALTAAGAVDCWGNNGAGQAEDYPGPYTQLSVGVAHTCALTPTGAVDCWGNNYYGQTVDQAGPYGPDYGPPLTTLTSNPADPSYGVDASFTFTGTDDISAVDALTFQCYLDATTFDFSACAAPASHAYASLAAGPHTFAVRARDEAGNFSETPITYTWTITSFTVGGTLSGLVGSGLVLAFNESITLPLTINGAFAFTPTLFSGESYSVTVISQPVTPTQTCTVTNASGTIATSNVTDVAVTCVDSAPPTTTITDNPSNPSASLDASFTFTGTDEFSVASALTFECQLDGTGFTACTASTSQSYLGLTPGSHTFDVRAVDAAGNLDATPASFTWTIAPLAVGGTVSGLVGNGLVLALNDTLTLPVTINGAFAFTPTLFSGEPYSVTVSNQPASPTQTCTVTNASGTIADTAITDVIVTCVDSAPPNTTITDNPSNPSASLDASFSFTGTDEFSPATALTFECQLDGSGFTACAAPTSHTYLGLAPGSHTFDVRAVDEAGNLDPSPATFTWTIAPLAVGGTLSGLVGNGLVLALNESMTLPLTIDGAFAFTPTLFSSDVYSVPPLGRSL